MEAPKKRKNKYEKNVVNDNNQMKKGNIKNKKIQAFIV